MKRETDREGERERERERERNVYCTIKGNVNQAVEL